MTNETGLLRDLNLKPGDRVVSDAGEELTISECGNIAVFNGGGSIAINCAWRAYTVTHRSPRTIGTLKEIGAKVGDVVESPFGEFTVTEVDLIACRNDEYRISRANPSPVRTVTKTEIVPGVYGKVRVDTNSIGQAMIGIDCQHLSSAEKIVGTLMHPLTKDELTEAINTLTEIRDAL